MKFFLYFLLFLGFNHVFVSCCASKMDALGIEDRTMYAMIHRAANQLQKKYNLSLMGQGGASDIENKTTEISASFETNRLLSIEEARTILLDSVDIFLTIINNDLDHRPYLQYYPFDVQGLDIAIFISNKDYSTPLHPDLCVASLRRGMIKYCTRDPENKNDYKSEICETYEKAIQRAEKIKMRSGQ